MLVETLETPLFLVAMPQIVDPFFNRSVVLLLEHNSEGSFGVVVNRPLDMTIASVSTELGIKWQGPVDERLFLGGPVQPDSGLALFGPGSIAAGGRDVREVAPGVFLASDTATLRQLTEANERRFRLLVGYAGWGEGQLENELTRNDWLIAPFDADLVFAEEPSSAWPRALQSIGVRPESLTAFISSNDRTSN